MYHQGGKEMANTLHISTPGYKEQKLRELKPEGINFSEWVNELIDLGMEIKTREKLLKMAQNRKEDVAALSKPGYSAPAVNYNGDHGIYLTRYTPPLW